MKNYYRTLEHLEFDVMKISENAEKFNGESQITNEAKESVQHLLDVIAKYKNSEHSKVMKIITHVDVPPLDLEEEDRDEVEERAGVRTRGRRGRELKESEEYQADHGSEADWEGSEDEERVTRRPRRRDSRRGVKRKRREEKESEDDWEMSEDEVKPRTSGRERKRARRDNWDSDNESGKRRQRRGERDFIVDDDDWEAVDELEEEKSDLDAEERFGIKTRSRAQTRTTSSRQQSQRYPSQLSLPSTRASTRLSNKKLRITVQNSAERQRESTISTIVNRGL